MYDEQVRTNKLKDYQSQERIDQGMNSGSRQMVGVSLSK